MRNRDTETEGPEKETGTRRRKGEDVQKQRGKDGEGPSVRDRRWEPKVPQFPCVRTCVSRLPPYVPTSSFTHSGTLAVPVRLPRGTETGASVSRALSLPSPRTRQRVRWEGGRLLGNRGRQSWSDSTRRRGCRHRSACEGHGGGRSEPIFRLNGITTYRQTLSLGRPHPYLCSTERRKIVGPPGPVWTPLRRGRDPSGPRDPYILGSEYDRGRVSPGLSPAPYS